MPQRRVHAIRAITVLAVLALLAAACGSSKKSTSTTKTTTGAGASVKLAFVGPLTGDNANLGKNILLGVKVAVDEATKAGLKIEIESFDTQGDPTQAPTVKDKYINDDKLIGIIGPTFSGETKAVLPAFDEQGLVMVSPSATNISLPTIATTKHVFHRVIPDDDIQGNGLSGYLVHGLKAKSLFYIDDNSDYGKGLADGTKTLTEKAGLKTIGADHIDPKSQDYSAAVNKAKTAKADVIFYGGYYSEAGKLKKQLSDAGVKSTFVSGDGSLDPGFVTSAGAAGAEGALLTCPCNLATPDASNAKLAAFAKAYKTLNGVEPGTYSTEGYDVANIYIAGIKAGNTTRAKMLDYVNNQVHAYPGLSKTIDFEANGNVKAGDVFVFEVKGGKITLKGTAASLGGTP